MTSPGALGEPSDCGGATVPFKFWFELHQNLATVIGSRAISVVLDTVEATGLDGETLQRHDISTFLEALLNIVPAGLKSAISHAIIPLLEYADSGDADVQR